MIISGKEVCPYFGEEQRKEWHRERGLVDPRKAKPPLPIATAGECGEEQVKKAKELEVLPAGKEKLVIESKEDKHARYRARKKEELAAKARARRAKK
jgi:hypothetical protein